MAQEWVLVIIGVVFLVVLIWSLRRKSKTIRRLFAALPKPKLPTGKRGKKH